MRSAEILLSHPRYELKKRASLSQACFMLSGDVDSLEAGRVLEVMEKESLGTGSVARLDLEELELLDGVAVARMVDVVRLLLGGSRRVEVFKSPQSLAHTLYRAGMLRGDARLELIEPRQEEGVAN